jgi:hypothetical protein
MQKMIYEDSAQNSQGKKAYFKALVLSYSGSQNFMGNKW